MERYIFDQLREASNEFRLVRTNILLPTDAAVEGSGNVSESARLALAANDSDVLIWGEVIELNGKQRPRLFIATTKTNARSDAKNATRLYDYEQYSLQGEFWRDLGNVLQLAVRTQATVFDDTRYQVDGVNPFVQRVRDLVESPVFTAKKRSGPRDEMWSSESRWQVLMAYAGALRTLGIQAGDNHKLRESVARYKLALQDVSRKKFAQSWALTMGNLGYSLARLGERESGTARLEEAVTAFRETLKEYRRDRAPLHWATTQNNLGLALLRLGARESGTARLEEAVTAFREALKEYRREREPLDWAMAQTNLGSAIATLGEHESGTARLHEAVAAFREALKVYTRDREPLYWAGTQNNLGNVLSRLGAREAGTARLEEAVAAYREALKECTRERVPLDWAMTQNNLGNALSNLGEREAGTARLQEAVRAFREALKEHRRDRTPLYWAMTQNNLGIALLDLGERESGTARLQEAVAAFREALKEYRRDRTPHNWAITQNILSDALGTFAARQFQPPCEAAEAHYRAFLVFESDASYYASKARESLAIDLASAVPPDPAKCPNISQKDWSRIRALLQPSTPEQSNAKR